MADNGLFVGRGCDPADLFGSEVAQFEHGRVRSIYGGAAYRYQPSGVENVNTWKLIQYLCFIQNLKTIRFSWTSCVQVSKGIIRGITTLVAKMNKHILQWKSVPNAGVKWRAGNIGVTQVFRKGFWVPTPQEVHCTHSLQQVNKQYL